MDENLKIPTESLASEAEDMKLLLELIKKANDLRNDAEQNYYNYLASQEQTRQVKTQISDATAVEKTEKGNGRIIDSGEKRLFRKSGMMVTGEGTATRIIGSHYYSTYSPPPASAPVYHVNGSYTDYDRHYGSAYIYYFLTASAQSQRDIILPQTKHYEDYTITHERKGTGIIKHIAGFKYPFWDILESVKSTFYSSIYNNVVRDRDAGNITTAEMQSVIGGLDADWHAKGLDDFDNINPAWVFENFVSGVSLNGTYIIHLTGNKLSLSNYLNAVRNVPYYQENGRIVGGTRLISGIVCPLNYNEMIVEHGYGDFLSCTAELAYLKKGLYMGGAYDTHTSDMIFLPTIDANGDRMAQTISYDVWEQSVYGYAGSTASDIFPYCELMGYAGPAYAADDAATYDNWLYEKSNDELITYDEWKRTTYVNTPAEIKTKVGETAYDKYLMDDRYMFYKAKMVYGDGGDGPRNNVIGYIWSVICNLHIPVDYTTYGRYSAYSSSDPDYPKTLFLARYPDYDEDVGDYDTLKSYFHNNFTLNYLAAACEGYVREQYLTYYDEQTQTTVIPPADPVEIAKIKDLITKIWPTITALIEENS